jgi:DegV family protein with EDD domain
VSGVIGLCTDSSAQLPPDLIERFSVEVVPVTIKLEGDEYLEGVDLDTDDFYERFSKTPRPEVTTSPPSSGQFAFAYDELVARGATEILSIHVGSALSGTLNAARLGARHVPVPIRHVDTGTASFGVGCCVWAAGEALSRGVTLEQAAEIAEQVAPAVGHVLVPGAPELVHRTGRASSLDVDLDGGVSVLSLIGGEVKVLARVAHHSSAAEAMAGYILDSSGDEVINVAIGIADRQGWRLSLALERILGVEPRVREMVRYRIGPSIGARTGPGTAGAFFYPVALGEHLDNLVE